MALSITNFRASFIWSETLLGVPGGTLKPLSEFQFLTWSDQYQERFRGVLDGDDPLRLDPPWEAHSNQLFWKYYLPGAVLAAVSPKQAWKSLVPLRRGTPFAVDAGKGATAWLEWYYYPHGIALALTFKYSGARTLQETVDIAWNMRRQGVVSQQTPAGLKPLSLQVFVDGALKWLRESVLGPNAQPGPQRGPFTLCTIIRAESDSSLQPIDADPDLHRALEALTSWPPNPEKAKLPDLASACPSHAVGDDDVLYARDRGRALWFPTLFTPTDRPSVRSLACYHRNLMFGSMQVDSLGGLVAAVAAELRGGKQIHQLSSTLRTCANNACERLADLFEGDKRRTYRSRSLKWQIQQNDLADLNFLRQKFLPGAADLPATP